MARPIVIAFAANVRDWLRGTGDVEKSLDDISSDLKQAGDDADKFERDFSDAMRDAERAADKAGDNISRDFKTKTKDGFGETGKEASQEFKQNLGESLASGDVSSIVQDTLGGLVSGLSGPLAGAAATLAGLATLAFSSVQKEAEQLKEFTESLASTLQGLYEQGIMTADKLEKLQAFNQFLEDQADTIDDLSDKFGVAGIASETYLTSLFQGGPALALQREELEKIMEQSNTLYVTNRGIQGVQSDQYLAAERLLGYLNEQGDKQGEIAGQMTTQASASQELARQLGLVDTNADGIIDDSDKIATNLTTANTQAGGLKQNLENIPSMIGVEIKYTASGYTGGAFQTSGGGQLTPVYKDTQRAE